MKGILWMASAALFFSLAFVIVRHLSATANIGAFEQTFFRHVTGIMILLPFIIRRGLISLKTQQVGLNIIRNFAGNAGMSLSFLSMTLIPLGEAVTLHFSLPLFVILFAILILRERVGLHRWVAMFVGFLGVAIALRPGFGDIHPGMLAAIGAAATYGLSDVLLRKLSHTDMTLSIVFYGFALQLPFSLPLAINEWVTPSGAEWAWLFFMGGLAFLAQWSLSRAYIVADASLVSTVMFIRLPIIAVLGFMFFGEVTDLWTWVGAAVIFVGTYYMARRETKAPR
jgi:drug/metabolite transporter (DMT)-like permease